jgi:cephalosporin-C deacetylase-like acetyl esterase
MLDRPRVIELAEMMGYDETAAWLRTHREAYAVGVFQGFQVIEEGETPCADSAEQ